MARAREDLLGGGWVLVFIAIVNSIIANSMRVQRCDARLHAMARNGAGPAPLARTHRSSGRRTSRSCQHDHRAHLSFILG